LLEKAQSNWEGAELMLCYRRSDDENRVNMAAYHLQQCAELMLKHFLEVGGIEYPKSHDIQYLLDVMQDNGIEGLDADVLAALEGCADTITNMESKTRYMKNYAFSIKKVFLVRKVLLRALIDSGCKPEILLEDLTSTKPGTKAGQVTRLKLE